MGIIGKLQPVLQVCLQTGPQRFCSGAALLASDTGVWTKEGSLRWRNVSLGQAAHDCAKPGNMLVVDRSQGRLPQGGVPWISSVSPVPGTRTVSSSGDESTGSRVTYQRFFSQWSRGLAVSALEGYDNGQSVLRSHNRQGDPVEGLGQKRVLEHAREDRQSTDVRQERHLRGVSEGRFEPRSLHGSPQGQTEAAALKLAGQLREDLEQGHADRVISAFDPEIAFAASPICLSCSSFLDPSPSPLLFVCM